MQPPHQFRRFYVDRALIEKDPLLDTYDKAECLNMAWQVGKTELVFVALYQAAEKGHGR